jgi:hypothetical protein
VENVANKLIDRADPANAVEVDEVIQLISRRLSPEQKGKWLRLREGAAVNWDMKKKFFVEIKKYWMMLAFPS